MHRRLCKARQDEAGISLIEILVVIAIIGILTSISIANIGKGQIAISNLENIRSWYEMVRRSALRGEACSISINNTNLSDGTAILTSSPTQSGAVISSLPCGSPLSVRLDSAYGREKYLLSVKSGSSDVNGIIITPRGTLLSSNGSVFSNDIIFSLRLASTGGQPISSSYCLKLSAFLGSVIGIGSSSCS